MSVKRAAVYSIVALTVLSTLFFIYYELNISTIMDNNNNINNLHGLSDRVKILQNK